MKKVLWFILVTTSILMASCAEHKSLTELELAEFWVPEGATVLAVYNTKRFYSEHSTKYVKFKFEGKCYLTFDGSRRAALTTINCPGDNK